MMSMASHMDREWVASDCDLKSVAAVQEGKIHSKVSSMKQCIM